MVIYPEGHHYRNIVSKVKLIYSRDGFCLLVELHQEGSAINRATPFSLIEFNCVSDPFHSNLQHTINHEMLELGT